jgi:hypothetical protein
VNTINKVTLIGFENAVFSKYQLDFVFESALALQEWVERYKISPESVEIDEAEEREEKCPGTVFTLAFAPANHDGFSVRYGVVPGVWSDEDEYFISEIKFDESDDMYPYTILDAFCTVCGWPASESKDCINCTDGELSIDLSWDENWNVTAEYAGRWWLQTEGPETDSN